MKLQLIAVLKIQDMLSSWV